MGNINDIVKTRHEKRQNAKGILYPRLTNKNSYHMRYTPSEKLNFFVEHFWIVKWELEPGRIHIAETLPHPSVHIVFEKNNTRILGIMKGKFTRKLKGAGKVFGIKFKPGGFYPFINIPVSVLTNRQVKLSEYFEVEPLKLEEMILCGGDDEEMISIAENFLMKIIPPEDSNVNVIEKIVNLIISEKRIIKVDDIVKETSLNKRYLQRLFNQYVGVSPKWMIKRYRLHEAAEKLAEDKKVDITALALDLGYFDQAHFIKDFKSVVGKTPAEYIKEIK